MRSSSRLCTAADKLVCAHLDLFIDIPHGYVENGGNMCEMKALIAINGFSCLRIFYSSKVNRGLLVGYPLGTYAHTPFF